MLEKFRERKTAEFAPFALELPEVLYEELMKEINNLISEVERANGEKPECEQSRSEDYNLGLEDGIELQRSQFEDALNDKE